MQLTSPSFQQGAEIPSYYTSDGQDASPELFWRDAPLNTKSFALIVHDPDAPRPGGFTHWVAYNIPASIRQIAENAPHDHKLPGGGIQGKNDYGETGYKGPCPPSGTHHYYFYLYALDTELKLKPGVNKQELEQVLQEHVLEKTELMGTYKKSSGKAA